jgi:hypothetical protein
MPLPQGVSALVTERVETVGTPPLPLRDRPPAEPVS